MTWIIIGVIVAIVIIAIVMMYNALVRLNQRAEEAWSDILYS